MNEQKSFLKILFQILCFVMLFIILAPSKPLFASSFTSNPPIKTSALTQPLGNLSIGDRVVDPSWQWEFKTGFGYSGSGETHPVIWIVVAKNHYGSNTGVTLLAEELIGKHSFDNSTNRGHGSGSNNWEHSGTNNATFGLRAWLNSTGSFAGGGFYNEFSDYFKSKTNTVTLPNKIWETGSSFSTIDRVFIPSSTELGDTVHTNSYEIGTTFEHFMGSDNASRIAQIGVTNWNYWTRSPLWFTEASLRRVSSGGGFDVSTLADDDTPAIRPAVNLQANTTVSLYPTSAGIYKILEIEEPANNLYASFTDAVYRYNGTTWGITPVAHAPAFALGVHDGQLYGAFADGIYYYNGTNWSSERITPGVAASLASYNNQLYGSFTDATYYYDGHTWTVFHYPTQALAAY